MSGTMTESAVVASSLVGLAPEFSGSLPFTQASLAINVNGTMSVPQGGRIDAQLVWLYATVVNIAGTVQAKQYSCATSIQHRLLCGDVKWKPLDWRPPVTNYSLVINSGG